jgi:hypothetical protein
VIPCYIMHGEVKVKKASEIKAPDGPQTDGMIRMAAIVDMSDQICGTGTQTRCRLATPLTLIVMIAKPHTASAVHHHGEEGMH